MIESKRVVTFLHPSFPHISQQPATRFQWDLLDDHFALQKAKLVQAHLNYFEIMGNFATLICNNKNIQYCNWAYLLALLLLAVRAVVGRAVLAITIVVQVFGPSCRAAQNKIDITSRFFRKRSAHRSEQNNIYHRIHAYCICM
jgi:hypothetical protein